jgi:hypothetical protein
MEFAGRLDAALKTRRFEAVIDRTVPFEEWWKRYKF